MLLWMVEPQVRSSSLVRVNLVASKSNVMSLVPDLRTKIDGITLMLRGMSSCVREAERRLSSKPSSWFSNENSLFMIFRKELGFNDTSSEAFFPSRRFNES